MDARAQLATVTVTINGQQHTVETPPMKRLLDLLREDLRLTGTKEGCGEGECGACAILLNGELANSCLIPALHADRAHITTIEGLAALYPPRPERSDTPSLAQPRVGSYDPQVELPPGAPFFAQQRVGSPEPRPTIPPHLSPIQQCFLSAGGAQCGICTPGMILATHALLHRHPEPSLLQIQEGLAGNLCRCTGYMRIFEAVQLAAAITASHPDSL